MATAAKFLGAPSVGRFSNFDLTAILAYQEDCIRDHKYSYLGRVTNIRLGIDDNAEYFRGDARRRLSASTKVVGLTIEWPQHDAPFIAFAPDNETPLFPGGIQHPPKMGVRAFQKIDMRGSKLPPGMKWNGTNLVADDKTGWVRQSMYDFASGKLIGRNGQGFVILQPIEQIIVLANVYSKKFHTNGTMLTLTGKPTFEGRRPFLLVSPDSPHAHIAGGLWTLESL